MKEHYDFGHTLHRTKCGPYPRQFFQLIFGSAIEDNYLAIQLRLRPTDAGGSRAQQEVYRSLKALEHAWAHVQGMNDAGYDVDFSVVPRVFYGKPNKERQLPDPPTFTCLWADMDIGSEKPLQTRKDATKQLDEIPIRPNCIVSSGRGIHPYYRLKPTKKISAQRFRVYLEALAKKLKAEVGAPTHAKRFLRVPNTINWRRGKQARFDVVHSKAHRLKAFKPLLSLDDTASQPDGTRRGKYHKIFRLFVRGLKATPDGDSAHGLRPLHDDEHPSFWVNLRTGRWGCHACGKKGRAEDLFGPLMLADNDARPLTWQTIPAFDPTFVASTRWIKKDFIPAKNITLIFGERGSFKSSYMVWVLRDIAARGRCVLILDYENPDNVLKERDTDLKLKLADNPNLKIWDRFADTPPPRPGDPRLEQIVRDALKRTKKSPILVFDSWASLLKPGEGGETTGQVAPIYNHFRRLCDLKATVLVYDHPRKYLKAVIYGGQDKEAKADVFHTFIPYKNEVKPHQPMIRVESWLKRHAPKGITKFAFNPLATKDEAGNWHVMGFEECGDPKIAERQRHVKIMRGLSKKNPSSSQEELVKLAAPLLSRNRAREVLKRGVEKKYWEVKRTAHGKLVYRLSD